MSRKLDNNADLCPDCGHAICSCDESWLEDACSDIVPVDDVTGLDELPPVCAYCFETLGARDACDCPDDEPTSALDRNYENALAILAGAPAPLCTTCHTPGCTENRGPDAHAGSGFGSLLYAYDAAPFPNDDWCIWCAGTGHPLGDESFGFCDEEHHGQTLAVADPSVQENARTSYDLEVDVTALASTTNPSLADEFFAGLAESHAQARIEYATLMTRIERRIETGSDARAHALVEPRVLAAQDEQKALDLASHFTLTTTQPPWTPKAERHISALDARARTGRCVCDLYPAQGRIEELREELADENLVGLERIRAEGEVAGWYRARARWQDETCRASLHLPEALLDDEGFAATHSLDPVRDFERIVLDDAATLVELHRDPASDEWMQEYAEDEDARREANIARKHDEFAALAMQDCIRLGIVDAEEQDARIASWNSRLEQRIAEKGDTLKGICSAIYAVQKAWGIEPVLDASERYSRSFDSSWTPTSCKTGRAPKQKVGRAYKTPRCSA